jgi:hypothetical protein
MASTWANVGFGDVELVGFAPGEFDTIYGKNMQLWRLSDVPPDQDYFKLVRLTLDTSGNMAHHVQLVDENGAPLPHIAVAQGWQDGPVLPADSIPFGGDPRGYPNQGNVDFSNAYGICEWIWGAGEGYDPAQKEGAHLHCVPMGPASLVTDCVYGFGWRWGTNHYKLPATFQRTVPDSGASTLEEVFADLFDGLSDDFAIAADALRAL